MGQVTTARRLVQLLHSMNRFAEANDALKFVTADDSSELWRKIVEDIKSRSGDVNTALTMAKMDAELHPDNVYNHLTYGSLLEKSGRSDDAEQAYRKAVAVKPDLPLAWETLVRSLVGSKKLAEAKNAVRDATKALADDPTSLARLYDRVNDRANAEKFLLESLEKAPNDLVVMRRVAEFYFNTNQMKKALPYVNQIIEKASKSTEKSDLDQLAVAALQGRGDGAIARLRAT